MRYTLTFLLILTLEQVTISSSEEDFYKVLGITKGARKNEVKRAYRSLSLKIHPDKNTCDPRASEKFYLLKEAFDTLYDEDRCYLYQLRNPHYGLENVEYDWNIPVCSKKVLNADKKSWLQYITGSGLQGLKLLYVKPLTFAYGVFHETFYLLTKSSFTALAWGMILYVTARVFPRSAVYQFLLLFVMVEGLLHFILIVKASQNLPSIFASWKIKAIALFLMWSFYLSALQNFLQIIFYGISIHNILVLQNYFTHLVLYIVGSFLVTTYYYWKYPLHKYQRHVLACTYLQQAFGILLLYSAINNKHVAATVCVTFISSLWCISKAAPYFTRACKTVIEKIPCAVMFILKLTYNTVIKIIFYSFNILWRILKLLCLLTVILKKFAVILPAFTVKIMTFILKDALQSLHRGILKVYYFVGSTVFPQYFSSRFTRFVQGEDHITQEERDDHKHHCREFPQTAESNEDLTDEE